MCHLKTKTKNNNYENTQKSIIDFNINIVNN